jgi:hypothetical protein
LENQLANDFDNPATVKHTAQNLNTKDANSILNEAHSIFLNNAKYQVANTENFVESDAIPDTAEAQSAHDLLNTSMFPNATNLLSAMEKSLNALDGTGLTISKSTIQLDPDNKVMFDITDQKFN